MDLFYNDDTVVGKCAAKIDLEIEGSYSYLLLRNFKNTVLT